MQHRIRIRIPQSVGSERASYVVSFSQTESKKAYFRLPADGDRRKSRVAKNVGASEGQPTSDVRSQYRSSTLIPNQYIPSLALFPFPQSPHKQTHGSFFAGLVLVPLSICKRYSASPPPCPHQEQKRGEETVIFFHLIKNRGKQGSTLMVAN